MGAALSALNVARPAGRWRPQLLRVLPAPPPPQHLDLPASPFPSLPCPLDPSEGTGGQALTNGPQQGKRGTGGKHVCFEELDRTAQEEEREEEGGRREDRRRERED